MVFHVLDDHHINPRAPGLPPDKMVGVGLRGLTTSEDMVGALGKYHL